jgi:hypothetical protein
MADRGAKRSAEADEMEMIIVDEIAPLGAVSDETGGAGVGSSAGGPEGLAGVGRGGILSSVLPQRGEEARGGGPVRVVLYHGGLDATSPVRRWRAR